MHSNAEGSFFRADTSLISAIAMTKIIANLNGKTIVRDKEIDFNTRVVVEHAFVVWIIAVLPLLSR